MAAKRRAEQTCRGVRRRRQRTGHAASRAIVEHIAGLGDGLGGELVRARPLEPSSLEVEVRVASPEDMLDLQHGVLGLEGVARVSLSVVNRRRGTLLVELAV